MSVERNDPVSELYKVNRGQLEHYDNSVNQRVIWLSIGQSFFFNVYAMLVTAHAPSADLMEKQKMLAFIFPIAALLTAIFTLFDVIFGLRYMLKLKNRFKESSEGFTNEGVYPPLYGNTSDRIFQHISVVMIPIIFVTTWFYLIMVNPL